DPQAQDALGGGTDRRPVRGGPGGGAGGGVHARGAGQGPADRDGAALGDGAPGLRPQTSRRLAARGNRRKPADHGGGHQTRPVPRGEETAHRPPRLEERIMITDDDLLLYHYRELDAAERARIG